MLAILFLAVKFMSVFSNHPEYLIKFCLFLRNTAYPQISNCCIEDSLQKRPQKDTTAPKCTGLWLPLGMPFVSQCSWVRHIFCSCLIKFPGTHKKLLDNSQGSDPCKNKLFSFIFFPSNGWRHSLMWLHSHRHWVKTISAKYFGE